MSVSTSKREAAKAAVKDTAKKFATYGSVGFILGSWFNHPHMFDWFWSWF